MMNGFSYPSSGNQLPQLTPLHNLPTHPYQQDSPGPSQILPPLHTQNQSAAPFPPNVYRSSNEAPRTPHTPATPGSAIRPGLNHVQGQTPLSATQPQQQFNGGPPVFTSAPPSTFQNTSINPSAATNGAPGYAGLPHMQPFYDQGSAQTGGMPFNGQARPPQPMDNRGGQEARLMPVVGSQAAQDHSQNRTMQPMKGPDGKYACQYCSKVYLHLKHLKRHHLRHTGERPYQCYLCHETFCRSDILKRHFQKCSLRRGNPTGASHLTHAQAHLQRGAAGSSSNPASATSDPGSVALASGFEAWRAEQAKQYIAQHEQGRDTAGQPFESNGSSRSNSALGGASGGDEKKRFSGGGSLTSVNTNIDTSPSSSSAHPPTGDLRNDPQIKREQTSAGGFQEPHSATFYTPSSAPPHSGFSQSENFPAFTYNSSNGYRPYPPGQQESVNGEPWSAYFQPGGQDPVMFSQH